MYTVFLADSALSLFVTVILSGIVAIRSLPLILDANGNSFGVNAIIDFATRLTIGIIPISVMLSLVVNLALWPKIFWGLGLIISLTLLERLFRTRWNGLESRQDGYGPRQFLKNLERIGKGHFSDIREKRILGILFASYFLIMIVPPFILFTGIVCSHLSNAVFITYNILVLLSIIVSAIIPYALRQTVGLDLKSETTMDRGGRFFSILQQNNTPVAFLEIPPEMVIRKFMKVFLRNILLWMCPVHIFRALLKNACKTD